MVTFLVISDENEKLEMRSIGNGAIALHCMMCKRVTSEEMMSFDIALAQLVPTHLVKMSKSLLRSLLICCRLSQWFCMKLDMTTEEQRCLQQNPC